MNINPTIKTPRQPETQMENSEPVKNAYRPDVETALAKHPFFAGMDLRQRNFLADYAMLEHFEPGDYLLRESDPANRFYLIITGKVILQSFVGNEKGRVTIQTLGNGETLGWSWLFPPFYWNFDAQAVEPTDVVFLFGTPLRAECEADHDFGYAIFQRISEVLVNRLQNTRKQLLHLG